MSTKAKVGDAIELEGLTAGELMEVTVTRVIDPAHLSDDYDAPRQGNRLVGVQLKLHNVGHDMYDDAPENGAYLIDSLGQRFEPASFEIAEGPDFPAVIRIASGDVGLGFIVFEIPETSEPAQFQYTLGSGHADVTAQWLFA